MTDQERWQAAFDYAGALKAGVGAPLAVSGVKGRFITALTDRLVRFWGEHKATLIPVLSQLAIAAFEALVAAKADIDSINPSGPR